MHKFTPLVINIYRSSKYWWLRTIKSIRYLLSRQVKETALKRLHRELWLDASWNINYIVFTLSACLIATFGLVSNSNAVIIGAMLIAPLMLPLTLRAGSLPIYRRDVRCAR